MWRLTASKSKCMISRYMQERLLYRLSISTYRERFILKGGALLYAHDRFEARPTLDIDFMATHINNDMENIKRIIKEICNIECVPDGTSYDVDTVEAEDITVNKEYHGVRVSVVAEKFHAMIVLSLANSRMKDFFDIYRILVTDRVDDEILSDAIKSTFENRETGYRENHPLFTEEFLHQRIATESIH